MNGADLLQWRRLRGLTQQQAADLIGVGRNSVSRWEKDEAGDVPRPVALAISAINRRLAPYPGKR